MRKEISYLNRSMLLQLIYTWKRLIHATRIETLLNMLESYSNWFHHQVINDKKISNLINKCSALVPIYWLQRSNNCVRNKVETWLRYIIDKK